MKSLVRRWAGAIVDFRVCKTSWAEGETIYHVMTWQPVAPKRSADSLKSIQAYLGYCDASLPQAQSIGYHLGTAVT
jgi:hypothetical protein